MEKFKGLVAATFTPLNADGSVNLEELPVMIEDAIAADMAGFYILGSTGEGISMTTGERKVVAEKIVESVSGRVPVIVQVGHNSIEESKGLARHAAAIGATAISANAPSYFKINNVDMLIECLAEICSAAPEVPFYYYHIPALTGAYIDMVEFLEKAPARIPSLVGIKFSELNPGKFLQCKLFQGGKYDILWGCDEQLLAAMAVGADAAVGSTYNFMPRLYQEVMRNYYEKNIPVAMELMKKAYDYVEILNTFAPIHPCMKATMRMLGYKVGTHRLPQPATTEEQERKLRKALENAGFFEWSVKPLKVLS